MVGSQDIWRKESGGGFVSENPLSSAQARAENPLSLVRLHASATSTQTKPQPSAPSHASTVSLRAGDTLWEVAQKKLGTGTRWRELHKADGSRFTGQEARHLQVGTRVVLPGTKPTTKTYHPGNSSFETPNVPTQVVRTGSVTRRDLTASTVKNNKPSASSLSRSQLASQQIVTGGITRRDRPNVYTHSSLSTKSKDSSDIKTNALLNGTVKGTTVGTFLVSRKLSPVPTEASRAAKPLVLEATLPDGSKSITEIPLRRVRYSQATVSPTLSPTPNDRKTPLSREVEGIPRSREVEGIPRSKEVKGIPLSKVVEGMRKHGWDYTKEPPDVVKFEGKKLSVAGKKIPIQRSKYVTLDHRRLVAAKEAGIKKVPARVHLEHDPINTSTDKKFPERRYSRRNPLKGQPRPNVPSKPGSAGFKEAERFRLEEGATYTDPKTRVVHSDKKPYPNNWGEAAKHRAANQRVRGHDNFPLKGQRSLPKISEPSASQAVKALGNSHFQGVAKAASKGQRSLLKISKPSASRAVEALENSHVRGVARGASKVLAPVAIGLDAWQLGSAYKKDGFGKEFRKEAGRVAGGWGMAAVGAAGGMAVAGPPGALVGGIIFGVAGSEFGDDIEQGAEKAGEAIAEGGKKLLDKLNPFG